MPLVVNDDNTLGFAYDGSLSGGDGVLQLDKIKGFEMSIVYLTGGGGTPTPTAKGSVLIDNLQLTGTYYHPFTTFDDTTGLFDAFDWMQFENDASKEGSIGLSINTTDKVEGTGSLQMDYTVNCSETWGGYVNMTHHFDAVPDSFVERTALVLYIKNKTPHTSTANRLTMRFTLTENSTGVDEDWVCEVPIDLSQASDWTRYYFPLIQDTVYTDNDGHMHFPAHGFAEPWWNETGDKKFDKAFLNAWKIELSGGGSPEYGAQGEKFTGTLLFDVLQESGYESADHTPPVAPENVSVVKGSYTNLVTWTDVPGEKGETYNVYASKSAITDVNASNVDVVALNVAEDVQAADHVILAPLNDQDVTYYYAVQCIDSRGNIGPAAATSSSVTNTAQGVSVIHWGKPANFAADGDLSDWSDVKPFRMFPSDGSGTVVANTTIDGDADCSCEAYLAMDSDSLYVAFNVTDDQVSTDVSTDSWMNDSPDLFLGLYQYHGKTHVNYKRGATPDYHVRFNKEMLRGDNPGADSLLVPGPAYYWEENFPLGYIVEAKIAWADLAAKTGDALFVPKESMSVPIDFEINDADGAPRTGQLDYSKSAEGNSYADATLWSYTFIGDKPVGVNDKPATVNQFSLEQNYPNPFNPTTKINYSIARPGLVSVRVYDILGRQVAQLVNRNQSEGSYSVDFNAANLSSGVYIYQIQSGSFTATKKMMLLK